MTIFDLLFLILLFDRYIDRREFLISLIDKLIKTKTEFSYDYLELNDSDFLSDFFICSALQNLEVKMPQVEY